MKNLTKIIILLFLSTNTFAQIPAKGLVSFFPFEGNYKDITNTLGNPINSSEFFPTPDTGRFNQPNGSYKFGIPYYYGLLFDDPSNKLPFKGEEFTVCLWVMRLSTPSAPQTQYILIYGDTAVPKGSEQGLRIYKNNAGFICASYDTNKLEIRPSINVNNWNFIAVIVKKDTIRLYVKDITGTLINEKEQKTNFRFTTRINYLSIGGVFFTYYNEFEPGSGWCGRIDDICIYNRALSEREIDLIYRSASSTINKAPTFIPSKIDTTIEVFKDFRYTINIQNDDDGSITYATNNNFLKIVSSSNSSITISATPQLIDTGKKTFSVIATDYFNDTSSIPINLNIKKPNNKPIIISKPDTIAYVNKEYTYEVKFSNATTTITLSIVKGSPYIPSNIRIEGTTIKWTPSTTQADKTFELHLSAKNVYEDTTIQIMKIAVRKDNTSIVSNVLSINKKENLSQTTQILYLINGKISYKSNSFYKIKGATNIYITENKIATIPLH